MEDQNLKMTQQDADNRCCADRAAENKARNEAYICFGLLARRVGLGFGHGSGHS
jgi:hypothetical protein